MATSLLIEGKESATALTQQGEFQRELLFGQAANTLEIFTGLAITNPQQARAEVTSRSSRSTGTKWVWPR